MSQASATPKASERLMKVLLRLSCPRKARYRGEEGNQYVFPVAPDATKPEIKAAVELMFKTQVNRSAS